MLTIWKQPCDEGQIRAGVAVSPCTRSAEPWVLAATILGSSLVFIDGTVVNVALPILQTELQATVVEVQWVFEAYALLFAALLLVGGSLGDRLGRRAMFGVGVTVFAAASAACGLAVDARSLIAARAIQGVGAALMAPASLAIISSAFPEERRGWAIGVWSSLTAISSAFGPVLGGWLIENASWRLIFFVNLPIALAVLGATFWRVPESRDEAAGQLDWWGALLGTVGLGGVVYGLIESSNFGLAHPLVLTALGVGAVSLVLFTLVEARSPMPMMPLGLFRSRTFAGVNLLTFLLYASLSGSLFFLPFNLIQVQSYSTTAAGAALLPFVLVMFALSRWSGALVDRSGAKLPLVAGSLVVAGATALYAVPSIGGSYWTTFFPAITAHGLGMALAVAPLTTVVMGSVDKRHVGLASGINNAVSRIAGLLAIAVMGIILLAAFNRSMDGRLPTLALPSATLQALDEQRGRVGAVEVPPDLTPEVAAEVRGAIDDAFVFAFRLVVLMCAGLALGGALTAVATIKTMPRVAKQATAQ